MSIKIASLNSGSNGNCYYVAAGNQAVLVDAGISCKETEKRMDRLGLNMQNVMAIFITHEHSDHIKGLEVLSKKYRLPVYITQSTLKNSKLKLDEELVCSFNEHTTICLGELKIKAFIKRHDAADPYSFVVSSNGVNIGVFTDIGVCCPEVIKHFKDCQAVFLEANYDTQLLENGRYPYYLKKRITGGAGHLSNDQALKLFATHKSEFMSHLILSHLSKDNNCSILVKQLFQQHAGNTQIVVASRDYESDLFHIKAIPDMPVQEINFDEQKQLALF